MTGRRRASLDGAAGGRNRNRPIRDLVGYIRTNLDRDLSLEMLASRAAMSTSAFSRWFRDQTGITPHAFVVNARVERAKELLRDPALSPLEISLAVGFSSQSCLNVTFRRHVGMTPVEWRDQISRKTKDTSPSKVPRLGSRPRLRPGSRSKAKRVDEEISA
ncbi:AraC family transcriptional regulator [Myxococcota bacterium]|nr:AraC family transcriptional regulator [Myxococcota bacterium]